MPDRTPVRMVILPRELHGRLGDYAAAYAEAYGKAEPLMKFVPATRAAFLDSYRSFVRRGSK